MEELKAQMKVVAELHNQDLAAGYDGVFLDEAVETKYPKAPAGYDIRVIQTMLGHSSLTTTMIYTHCVPMRTVKEPKSPLDF